jgi:hypothetical protein
MEFEELERIWAVDAKAILSRTVIRTYTEYDVMKSAIDRASRLIIGEREVTVPGLSRNSELILKVLADFKAKKRLNVVPLQYAKSDDITMEVGIIRPEYFGLDTYLRTGLAVGTCHIIPTAAGTFSVPTDNICIITDLVELQPTRHVPTVVFADVDGVSQKPLSILDTVGLTDMHLYEIPFPVIADSTLDLDGKVESAGDAEIAPIGAWICLGKDVKPLT